MGLPRFNPGSPFPVSASEWNELVSEVERIRALTTGGGLTGLNLPSGRSIVQGGRGDAAILLLHEFRIVDGTGYPDTILCDSPASGLLNIHVAKPYLLRRTPFDGKRRDGIEYTYTSNAERKATRKTPPPPEGQAEPTENQKVIAKWIVGDVIYAMAGVFGGLGGIKTEIDGPDAIVEWLDHNNDGRYWAKV